MRRTRNLARGAALAALLAIALAACGGYSNPGGKDQQSQPQQPQQAQPQQPGQAGQADAAFVQVAENAELGQILSDSGGRTLYAFTKDGKGSGRSVCDGQCIATWPALTASGTPLAGGGVEASLLGTIQRNDGTTQVTYNDWPLYFYGADLQAGQAQGQGINGVWFVVSPQGKLVKTAAGAGSAESGQSSGSSGAESSSEGYSY